MSTLTVIQARLGSTRLPGKVLLPLGGGTVLEVMLDRVRSSNRAGTVLVATTYLDEDKPIVDLCRKIGAEVFCGHPTDCLDRHFRAMQHYEASAVVKIPSDCPLIDPRIIDRVIQFFEDGSYDYVSNLHPQSYPDGNDVEIFTQAALARAHAESTRLIDREHTTTYLWDNPDKFRLGNVTWERGQDFSQSHRWTLDYREDYDFICAVYDRLYQDHPRFSLDDILKLLESSPQLRQINANRLGDMWYARHADELRSERSGQL